jgi:hypothetical protein
VYRRIRPSVSVFINSTIPTFYYTYKKTPRQQNQTAHSLAKEALAIHKFLSSSFHMLQCKPQLIIAQCVANAQWGDFNLISVNFL